MGDADRQLLTNWQTQFESDAKELEAQAKALVARGAVNDRAVEVEAAKLAATDPLAALAVVRDALRSYRDQIHDADEAFNEARQRYLANLVEGLNSLSGGVRLQIGWKDPDQVPEPPAEDLIAYIADTLHDHPEIRLLCVQGSTDSKTPKPAYNRKLRATRAKKFLALLEARLRAADVTANPWDEEPRQTIDTLAGAWSAPKVVVDLEDYGCNDPDPCRSVKFAFGVLANGKLVAGTSSCIDPDHGS